MQPPQCVHTSTGTGIQQVGFSDAFLAALISTQKRNAFVYRPLEVL